MMTDHRTPTDIPTDPAPEGFGDLPIQPTGSGVADLEIAYEQMRLSEDDAGDAMPVDPAAIPTDGSDDAVESAAHPS
ncbi:hypothetical protein ASG07_11570 [Sphingomonas sp. Leaf343]|nr:hypothetical protein ASG07_11570 [Sphingomonas sp. Leaf343]